MVGQNFYDYAIEDTFGVAPAAGVKWRSIQVMDDGHKVNVLDIMPQGIVRGQQGPLMNGSSRSVETDAEGVVKTYLASNGLGGLFLAGFGSAVLSTPVGATTARKMVFTTTSLAAAASIAGQYGREFTGGGVDSDTYVGGKVKEMRLSQAPRPAAGSSGVNDEAIGKVEFDFGYQRRQPGYATHPTSTLVNPDLYWSVGECTLSVGVAGTDMDDLDPTCINKCDIKIPTGVTDSPCISPSFAQEEMTRGEMPEPTMDLGWDYKDRTLYDAYLAGTVMSFRQRYVAPDAYEIEDGIVPSLTLDVPAFKFTGSTPQFANKGRTTQELPCRVGHNGTDPMITLTLITSDTAF